MTSSNTSFKNPDFEKELEQIIKEVRAYYPDFDADQEKRIRDSFWFAKEKHEGQKRYSGEPYFIHPVAATNILISIKPDIETIQACLLHDVIDDTDATPEEIEEKFGKKIRFLTEGVSNVSKVQLKNSQRELGNIRKLFVAMAQDIRVVFIKLADRIHNLSTLKYVPEKNQKRIAKESLEVYAPVANKLGLFGFKTQIEDYSFKHLYPRDYAKISAEVTASRNEQKEFIEKAKKEIEKVLEVEKIDVAEIHGRPKNLYSIYAKMKRKEFSSVSEVFDLFAIRILVKAPSDCYRVLGILHSKWHPIPKRFKDYISIPKPNGYQSLHTTILGFGKVPLEIQIKTMDMHLDAEYGPAAHWAYKHAKHSNFDNDYVKRMDWFPQHIPTDEQEPLENFYEKVSQSILGDRVYVFTPKGEIITLPVDSTPVDFAFAIHSDIGASCVGAKVDGMIKTLDYKLQSGQVVEILTQKGRTPNPEWLNFVKSSRTIGKIKNYINKLREEDHSQQETSLLRKKQPIVEKIEKPPILQKLGKLFTPTKKEKPEIVIGGARNLPYHLASCCKPRVGKNIIAYKTRGLRFTIHEMDCKELPSLDPSRFLEAYFKIEKLIEIQCRDRIGLFKDISQKIANHGINITQSVLKLDKKENITYWSIRMECTSTSEYEELIKELKNVPEVITLTKN